jgi:biopolymer transport protein ExbB/TolQ
MSHKNCIVGLRPALLAIGLLLAFSLPTFAAEPPGGTSASPIQQIAKAVSRAGIGLTPLVLMSAWLVSLTTTRLLAYGNSRIFKPELSDMLKLAMMGSVLDINYISRVVLSSRGALANVIRAVVALPGRTHDQLRAALEDAVEYEGSRLRAPNGWFDVIYAISTLVGLLSALFGLIQAYAMMGEQGPGGSPELNSSVASALAASGLGVGLAVISRVVAEAFRQRQLTVVREMFWLVLPLVDRISSSPASPSTASSSSRLPVVFQAKNGVAATH